MSAKRDINDAKHTKVVAMWKQRKKMKMKL